VFKTQFCLKRYRSLPMEFPLLHVPITAPLRKYIPFALSLELPVSVQWRYDSYLIKLYTKKFGLIWRHDARATGDRYFISQILCRSTRKKSEKKIGNNYMAYVFEAHILLCLLSYVIQPYAWVICRNMTRENKKPLTSMEPTN